MRRTNPGGASIIHIFFRDGMIYFAIIFGAVSFLVREPGSLILIRIPSHGHLVPPHLPLCYVEFSGLGLLVCPHRSILAIRVLTPIKSGLYFHHPLCMPADLVNSCGPPILSNPNI